MPMKKLIIIGIILLLAYPAIALSPAMLGMMVPPCVPAAAYCENPLEKCQAHVDICEADPDCLSDWYPEVTCP